MRFASRCKEVRSKSFGGAAVFFSLVRETHTAVSVSVSYTHLVAQFQMVLDYERNHCVRTHKKYSQQNNQLAYLRKQSHQMCIRDRNRKLSNISVGRKYQLTDKEVNIMSEIRGGDIWMVDFGVPEDENDHKLHGIRPVVIVSNDSANRHSTVFHGSHGATRPV